MAGPSSVSAPSHQTRDNVIFKKSGRWRLGRASVRRSPTKESPCLGPSAHPFGRYVGLVSSVFASDRVLSRAFVEHGSIAYSFSRVHPLSPKKEKKCIASALHLAAAATVAARKHTTYSPHPDTLLPVANGGRRHFDADCGAVESGSRWEFVRSHPRANLQGLRIRPLAPSCGAIQCPGQPVAEAERPGGPSRSQSTSNGGITAKCVHDTIHSPLEGPAASSITQYHRPSGFQDH